MGRYEIQLGVTEEIGGQGHNMYEDGHRFRSLVSALRGLKESFDPIDQYQWQIYDQQEKKIVLHYTHPVVPALETLLREDQQEVQDRLRKGLDEAQSVIEETLKATSS